MVLFNLVPSEEPWDIHLDPVEEKAGVYAVHLHDAKTWVEAGPLYLRFPTPEYAFAWLEALAKVDTNAYGPRTLEEGHTVAGIVDPNVWRFVLTGLYHAAPMPGYLESLWWYGNHEPWTHIDPLAPPSVVEAEQILFDALPKPPLGPTSRIFEYGVREFLDADIPPIAIAWVDCMEYIDEDSVIRRRLTVRCPAQDDEEFESWYEPEMGDDGHSMTVKVELYGRIKFRPLHGRDEALVSQLFLGRSPEMLVEHLATIEHCGHTPDDDEHPELVEIVEALVGPGGHQVFAMHYFIAIDGHVQFSYWRGQGEWEDGCPPESPQWQAEEVRLNGSAQLGDSDESLDAILEMWTSATSYVLDAFATGAMLERFDSQMTIDVAMAEIASHTPDELLHFAELPPQARLQLTATIGDLDFTESEVAEQARVILDFVNRGIPAAPARLLAQYILLTG